MQIARIVGASVALLITGATFEAQQPFNSRLLAYQGPLQQLPLATGALLRFEESTGRLLGLQFPSVTTFFPDLVEIDPLTGVSTLIATVPTSTFGVGNNVAAINPMAHQFYYLRIQT